MFEIRQSSSDGLLPAFVHVAFNAPSMKTVDDFYDTAFRKGAKCNEASGF